MSIANRYCLGKNKAVFNGKILVIKPGSNGSVVHLQVEGIDPLALTDRRRDLEMGERQPQLVSRAVLFVLTVKGAVTGVRSEEHTSELQSLMRTSYAVF